MHLASLTYKSLQQSELKRFLRLETLYETATKNPLGLRFSNLQRALNVLAAAKFVGWNDAAIDLVGFQQSVLLGQHMEL